MMRTLLFHVMNLNCVYYITKEGKDMNRKYWGYCLGAVLLLPMASIAEEAEVIYQYRSLSLESASKAAWGAIKDCRKKGYSVAVAVVDRGGNLQALLKDRFAGPHTPETAKRKAWTANSFRQNTGDLGTMLKEGKIPSQVQHNPGALLLGGGLKIEVRGETIGAIGVSGAPPGKSEKDSIDGQCGQAGIDLIMEELEFAD